jgi:MFS family permease
MYTHIRTVIPVRICPMEYRSALKRNIRLAYVKSFLTSLLFFLPIWYAFETQFAPPETLAIIYAVTHLVTVFLELPTGALADLLGRRITVFLGLVIQGAAWIWVSGAKSAADLWIGYAASEVGATLISGADTALNYDTLKELGMEKTYGAFAGKTHMIYRIGIIGATLAGGYLFGITKGLPYAAVGVTLFAAAVATLLFVEPHIDSEKFTLKNYVAQTKLGMREIFKNPYIRDYSLYYVTVGSITWYFVYFLDVAYLSQQGFSQIQLGWIMAGINAGIGIGVYLLTNKMKLSRTAVYVMFPAVMAISFLPAVFVPRTIAVLLTFAGYFIAVARWSVLDQYANLEFDSRYRATALSALSMVISIAYTGISFAVGPVLSRYGAAGVMSVLGILTLVTAFPAATVLIRNHGHRVDPSVAGT